MYFLVRFISLPIARTIDGRTATEVGNAEGPEQLARQHAHFRRRSKARDRRADGGGARPHDDENALGVWRAVVLEQVVRAGGEGGEAIHRALHDADRGPLR